MRCVWWHVAILMLIVGCSGETQKAVVTLNLVPEPLMKIAVEKMPDVRFDRAWKKSNGNYVLQGKNRLNKIREIDLTEAGEITAID